MKMRKTVAAVVAIGIIAGCGGAQVASPVEGRRAAMVGGDSRDVTADQALPAAAVGWLRMSDRVCSAIPIKRDVVLTAGHCLCDLSNPAKDSITFHLPHVAADGTIADETIGSQDYFNTDTLVCDTQSLHFPERSARDLGIVILARPIPVTVMPDVPRVYTFGDFLDRSQNRPSDPLFSGNPTLAVGFGGSIPRAPLRTMADVHGLVFDRNKTISLGVLCSLLGCDAESPGWWIHDEIDEFPEAGERLELGHGDSGGPLTFTSNRTTPTVMGVFSLFGAPAGVTFNAWSPTWDNGLGNGGFIRQFLEDADDDGVTDANDNCPPSRCTSPEKCANPDQADDDQDGVGDRCDNCRGIVCSALGHDLAACDNPHQEDRDGDGIGDICDVCPGLTSFDNRDTDADGVGDACDLCSNTQTAGRRACQADSDCGGGFCILEDVENGGTCNGRACGSAAVTRFFLCTVPCAEHGQWGYCSQTDELDSDGDGIGDSCDNCKRVADANMQIDSNAPAEDREVADQIKDACDTTAVMTTRPVLEPANQANTDRTLFTSYAGVGSEDQTAPAPAFTGAEVGFRQCNCRNVAAGSNLDFARCLNRAECGTQRAKFDGPRGPGNQWTPITIAAGPPGAFDESQLPVPSLDQRADPTYTSNIDCGDPLPHPLDQRESTLCRLGTGRLLRWSTKADIDANRVTSYQPPSFIDDRGNVVIPPLATIGIIWTHGADLAAGPGAGARDRDFAGRLRDHYAYVGTPAVAPPAAPRIVPTVRADCRTSSQCFATLSSLWLRSRILPVSNTLGLVRRPVSLVTDPVGRFTAVRRAADPVIDLGPALTTGGRLMLSASDRLLLNPVEHRVRPGLFQDDTLAVSVPRSWSQLDSDVECLGLAENGQLDITCALSTFGAGEAGSGAFGGLGFVPSNREGARFLYSKLEGTLYMIGGARSGQPTGEIWRLDLATNSWSHLFMSIDRSQALVRAVAAAGYDPEIGKLLVLDNLNHPTRVDSRLLVFDTHRGDSKVSAALNLSGFTKVSLTASGGGEFVLVGSHGETGWAAYRLRVNGDGTVTWLGKTSGTGLVTADPIPSEQGLSLFTQTAAGIDVREVAPSSFGLGGPPPELSICTHAPVIAPLPDLTLTSCHGPVLPVPVPADSCGVAAVANDQPTDFPLGTTMVTWTFTDPLGNIATAAQKVIVVLGDDPTCCPAGTNVISGTASNDTLIGTAGSDCILGLGGQDRISGGGGDDFISGGDGDDALDGGGGNDNLSGGSGQDQLAGGTGNDTLSCGDGDDVAHGDDGSDTLRGGQGQDRLFGDNGNDKLFGDDGDDRLSGGAGGDTLDGGENNNACSGGSGANTLLRCSSFF